MITKVKNKIKKDQFIIGVSSILTNPFFIIRKGIYDALKDVSLEMKGRLLDVGCGSKPYKQLFDVEEYIGIDVDQSGHPHDNEDIDIFYDGKRIPFSDNYFDSVFASEVFEHVFNLNELMMEISRVTKKGGKLLITVPFVWDEHEVPYDFARYSSFGLKHILESNGFEIIYSKKTTTFVETLSQLFISYIYQCIFPKNKIIRFVLTPIFIMPLSLVSKIISKILPDSRSFYHNNVICSVKV